ncbi:MAG TPA: serine/threonine-protein kinase, partial [Vicinamibacterales bacterium]
MPVEAPTVSATSDAPTHRAPDPPTAARAAKTPSDSGWLTSSGAIDHGRFAPGAVLDGRYRIMSLLGRGGMGEVYRADDLRLGQTVALKFLPADLSQSATRLAQFHNEVRIARQVSHANVCRVYDIGEIDRQIYLSMEYVDGEDLASLIRRIGRLPEDKAVEIARQVCAGLAAAHDRGVIHRDLKPSNIMLDGTGRARIMDFGLAAIGEVTDVRSGTPSYMAPEQLAGREVTTKSDIYSLGLVLYELFTGRRAYAATTLGELVEQHASGSMTPPTSLVKTLDPTIERAILRCLEHDPALRPASALTVAASLPGGDPLAAALAAGETPSPAMVAAVGGDAATLSPLSGLLWLAATAVVVIVAAVLSDRVSILSKT